MVHCADCGETPSEKTDVEFVERDETSGLFAASKRFSLVACTHCGAAIGSGVAGAKA